MSAEEEACIVAASYQGFGSQTVVELWLRAREGHSTLLLVHGLRPFLEIAVLGKTAELPIDIEERLEKVRNVKDVTLIHSPVDKWTDLGIKPHWKVEVKQPYNVPKIREALKTEGWIVSSADIIFPQRLLLDLDLGPHIAWKGQLLPKDGDAIRDAGGRGLYPTDQVARCHIDDLQNIEAFAAPFITFSFDLETSIETGRILCAAAVVQQNGQSETHTFRGDEREMMEGLTRLVRDSDPDIITGYNIDNFDLPRIKERMEELEDRKDRLTKAALAGWARVPITEDACKGSRNRGPQILAHRQLNRKWTLTGRCVMDAWWEARMTLRPKRETLKFVSELLFPDREELRKMDVDASRMDEEWAARPDVVLEYCAQDALLPIEILDAISATARKEALAAVGMVPLETAIIGSTSQWLDSLVIRLADRENIAVPMTRRGGKSDAITGGYVHDIEGGRYPWVAVLDFKSMYPSIMITNNICHTTRVDNSDETTEVNQSPSGTKFLKKEVREGLVPRLLQDLMSQRDEHKALMKNAQDASVRMFHDQMQSAVKILMNTFYGVFASAFYRFTHQDIGSAITAWARSNIKKIIYALEEEGHPVVYSDTDSVFVSAPDEGKETLVSFGHELANRFTKEGAELEFEKGLSVFFSHGAKKRYVGRVVWPEEELLIRGYEVRRTDSFDLLNKTMMGTFEKILDGDEDEACKQVIGLIRSVKAGEVDVADLIISRSCKGKVLKDGTVDFSVYSNPDGLPYVQAARKRIARGLQFTPGMKVSYIVTDAKKRPLTVEPWLVAETGDAPPVPDWSFYAERLARAMGRITEVYGWSDKDLLLGSRQQTFNFF
ncbi:MAG: DNA polymerase domain-containing protein [Candidatus Thalassarchaeaceae archaeon]|jgi:DNA polymerase, archaea type|nr:DNA polymerase domain-containing protein [Candidatus Thalassarchaeaceae archaeon]